MFDAYEEMSNLSKALEYRQGMVKVKEKMFADNSEFRKVVDGALSFVPRRYERSMAEPNSLKSWRRWIMYKARAAEKHRWFHATVNGCIALSGVAIAFTTDKVDNQAALSALSLACLVVFTLEAACKVLAAKWSLLKYLRADAWNRFDFLIVVTGWLEVSDLIPLNGLAVFRLLRMLRVARLLRALPRMRSIVESLVQGMGSVVWVVVLMAIFNYIMGCLGVVLFQFTDPFHFATVQQALFTIYSIETFDTWDLVYRVNMYGCSEFPGGSYPFATPGRLQCDPSLQGLGWVAAAYFVFVVVVFGGLILPTMLIGIVAISFEESFRKNESESEVKMESASMAKKEDMPDFFTDFRLELLEVVFEATDIDNGGSLDLNEVTPLLKYIARRHLNVNLCTSDAQRLALLFDADDSSDLNFGEFVIAIRYLIKARDSGLLTHVSDGVPTLGRLGENSFNESGGGGDVCNDLDQSIDEAFEEEEEDDEDFDDDDESSGGHLSVQAKHFASHTSSRSAVALHVAMRRAETIDGLGSLSRIDSFGSREQRSLRRRGAAAAPATAAAAAGAAPTAAEGAASAVAAVHSLHRHHKKQLPMMAAVGGGSVQRGARRTRTLSRHQQQVVVGVGRRRGRTGSGSLSRVTPSRSRVRTWSAGKRRVVSHGDASRKGAGRRGGGDGEGGRVVTGEATQPPSPPASAAAAGGEGCGGGWVSAGSSSRPSSAVSDVTHLEHNYQDYDDDNGSGSSAGCGSGGGSGRGVSEEAAERRRLEALVTSQRLSLEEVLMELHDLRTENEKLKVIQRHHRRRRRTRTWGSSGGSNRSISSAYSDAGGGMSSPNSLSRRASFELSRSNSLEISTPATLSRRSSGEMTPGG